MIETQYVVYTADIMEYRVRPHPDHKDNEIILIEGREPGKEWVEKVSFLRNDAVEIARCMIGLALGEGLPDIQKAL